jgi:hypothetical protein
VRNETISIVNSGKKEPRESGPLAGLFVFLPLMAVVAVVSLPFLPIVAWWENRRRRLLDESMTKQNRTMSWSQFIQAAEEKRGTLVVEGDPRKGPNLWWTPEDIPSISPHTCARDLGALFNRTYKPFWVWCRKRYISRVTGSALLVLGGDGQRREVLGSEDGTAIFQNIPIVFLSTRRL